VNAARANVALLVAAAVVASLPASAQDPTSIVPAVEGLLKEGILGLICVVEGFVVWHLFRVLKAERDLSTLQLKSERDAATEKLLVLSMSHAAGEAKITALMDRIVRHLEKGHP